MPDAGDHPAIRTVADALRSRGASGDVRVLPDSARTAAEAAGALGCDVGAIANSLLFDAGGEPLLILTSGTHRVDTTKVAAEHALPALSRASAEFVRSHTGQAIGGVSPVGHPAAIRTFVDKRVVAPSGRLGRRWSSARRLPDDVRRAAAHHQWNSRRRGSAGRSLRWHISPRWLPPWLCFR